MHQKGHLHPFINKRGKLSNPQTHKKRSVLNVCKIGTSAEPLCLLSLFVSLHNKAIVFSRRRTRKAVVTGKMAKKTFRPHRCLFFFDVCYAKETRDLSVIGVAKETASAAAFPRFSVDISWAGDLPKEDLMLELNSKPYEYLITLPFLQIGILLFCFNHGKAHRKQVERDCYCVA